MLQVTIRMIFIKSNPYFWHPLWSADSAIPTWDSKCLCSENDGEKKGAIYWLLTKPIWGHSVTLWTDTAVPLLLYFGQSSCRTCVLYAANQPVLKHVAVTDMSNVNRDGGQRLKEFKEIVTVQKQHVHLGSVQVSQTAKQLTTQRSWNWKNVNVNVTLL